MNNKTYDTKYNKDNIFYKICISEKNNFTNKILYENDNWLIIEDINKQAKFHFLIITKNMISCWSNYIVNANTKMHDDLKQSFIFIESNYKIQKYKIIINNGDTEGQEIMHLHIHVLSNNNI